MTAVELDYCRINVIIIQIQGQATRLIDNQSTVFAIVQCKLGIFPVSICEQHVLDGFQRTKASHNPIKVIKSRMFA